MPHLLRSGDAAGLGLPKRCGSDFFFFFSASWAARLFGSSKRFFEGPLIVAGREVVRASVLVLSGAVGSEASWSWVELHGEGGERRKSDV